MPVVAGEMSLLDVELGGSLRSGRRGGSGGKLRRGHFPPGALRPQEAEYQGSM